VPPSSSSSRQHRHAQIAPTAGTVQKQGSAEILILSGGPDTRAASFSLQDGSSCTHQHCTVTSSCRHTQAGVQRAGTSPFAVQFDPACFEVQAIQQQLRRASVGSCYEHTSCTAGSGWVAPYGMPAGAAAARISSSSMQLHAQRRKGRPSTAGVLAHRPNSAAMHGSHRQPQHKQQAHVPHGDHASSASSSSRSSSRPSTGDTKQQLQPAGSAVSGWSRWAGLARRWSLGNFPSRLPSRGPDCDAGSSPPGSPPDSRGTWRPVSRGQQHVLREFMQVR
jgi:hypothetical protein